MTKFALTLAALTALGAGQALAETAAPAVDAGMAVVADADANGSYSLDEVKLAYPALTEEIFKAADTNADGVLSAEELKAAEETKIFAN